MVLPPMHRSAKPFPLHHQASKQPNHTKSPWMKQQLGLPGSSDTKTLLCRRREGGREGPQAPSPPAGTGELSVQSAESREHPGAPCHGDREQGQPGTTEQAGTSNLCKQEQGGRCSPCACGGTVSEQLHQKRTTPWTSSQQVIPSQPLLTRTEGILRVHW